MSNKKRIQVKYPRRRFIRTILRVLANMAIAVVTKIEITGRENLPAKGPFMIIGNHFSFVDPVFIMAKLPFWVEFVGGTMNPGAPKLLAFIPKLWGILNVYRGSSSRDALKSAQSVLAQDGVLCIFPEGGNWATVLRPARPGAPFLMHQMKVPILPIGFIGLDKIFQDFNLLKPKTVKMVIGKPFGPLGADIKGRPSRDDMDEMGHEMMKQIALLISPEQRGHYSEDPAMREAAKGTEVWPWDTKREGEVDRWREKAI
jgi:1-acyl-sn-glycerol-3-phosphate acyltransferase